MSDHDNSEFSSTFIADLIGEKLTNFIAAYLDRGLITPSIQDASGHNSRRIFNLTDLLKCFIAQRLRRRGYKPQQIRETITMIPKKCLMSEPFLIFGEPGAIPIIVPRDHSDLMEQLVFAETGSWDHYVISVGELRRVVLSKLDGTTYPRTNVSLILGAKK